ncbi:hypothetical protein SB778_01875 [Paraburkholderia sp. SIMBA_050]|nr:hypothetical protein CUJ90_22150 [Paraburkholderia terricola]ORC52864.1 hypothetical protein B2G74_10120 [Burkholderia sp. A27]
MFAQKLSLRRLVAGRVGSGRAGEVAFGAVSTLTSSVATVECARFELDTLGGFMGVVLKSGRCTQAAAACASLAAARRNARSKQGRRGIDRVAA